MEHLICSICGDGTVDERVQPARMDLEGNLIEYKSRSFLCGGCRSEFVTLEQSQLNNRAVSKEKYQSVVLPNPPRYSGR